MPFSDAWNDTDPPGSELAKNIDDHIRKLRLQIDERMEAMLVEDWAADPLAYLDAVSGKKTGKQILIPFGAFLYGTTGSTSKGVEMHTSYVETYVDTGPMIAPVILPPGVTVTLVELMADKGDTTSVSWQFSYRLFSAGGSTDDENVIDAGTTFSTAGIQIKATGALTEVIAANTLYWIRVSATGSSGQAYDLFGARITYDTPAHLNTI